MNTHKTQSGRECYAVPSFIKQKETYKVFLFTTTFISSTMLPNLPTTAMNKNFGLLSGHKYNFGRCLY